MMDSVLHTQKLLKNRSNEKLPSLWAILLIAFFGVMLGLSFKAYLSMPDDLYHPKDSEEFSGVRAKFELSQLTFLGPRKVGSTANEIHAVNFLKRRIDEIISESNGLYTIETDIQVVSGVYKTVWGKNVYDSVQNVIVKITPKNSSQRNALLINSHFDSVLTSPGAGDDGAMVAVMLTVLSTLTKSKNVVRHPIIFLFNGDEENGLEASHGFMNHHKWAKDAKAAINLEGMGVGGKELLFQSGPKNNWLHKYYRQAAKHPFASVIGEEIFENDLIPVKIDTDLRMFYEFGNVSGLNLANIKNGFYYHTHLDKLSNVDDGSLQHGGDNVLALARALANAEELDDDYELNPTGNAVYFDVFGLFFIYYSEETGKIINISVASISLLLVGISVLLINFKIKSSFCDIITQFVLSLIIQLGTIALGAGLLTGIAVLIDLLDYSMSWHSHSWTIFGLYFCPFFFILAIIPGCFLSWRMFTKLPLNFSILLFLHSQCVILAAVIFASTVFNVRIIFIVTYTLGFYSLALLINLITGFHQKRHAWIIPVILCQSVPFAFTNYLMQILFTVFIPISARQTRAIYNPELMVALAVILITLLIFGFIAPIFSIFHHGKTIISTAVLIFIVFFILLFTSICFPYTPEVPQRQRMYHTTRAIHNSNGEITYQDAIFAMIVVDRHAEETIKDITAKNGLKIYSSTEDLSELVWYGSQYRFAKAPPFDIPDKSELVLLSKEDRLNASVIRYNFQITGAAKSYQTAITPLNGNMVFDWSFRMDDESAPLNIDKLVALNVQFGKSSPPYDFWIDIMGNNTSECALSISFHTVYYDEHIHEDTELNRFMATFPDWTVVTGFTATLDYYVF